MRQLKIDKSFTSRDQESLGLYLQDLRKYPVLSAEEEIKLGMKILEGDESAVHRLVNSNLRFVISVAKKYEAQGLLLADLIAEGNLGLIKAARRFDHTKGFKFISFAVWWIRQAMQSAIDQHRRLVRLPTNHLTDIMNMRNTAAELEQQLERTPTLEELAEASGIPIDKLKAYQYSSQSAVSMDVPGDESEASLYSVLEDVLFPPPDSNAIQTDMRLMVSSFLDTLPQGEREILELMFGISGEQISHIQDIATAKNLCVQTVRSYKNRGLATLRAHVQFGQMRQYLSS